MGRNKSVAKGMTVYKSLENQEQTQGRLEVQCVRQAAFRSVETTGQTQARDEDQHMQQKQPSGQHVGLPYKVKLFFFLHVQVHFAMPNIDN